MAINLGDFEQKCKASIEHFKQDLTKIRTGRASSSMGEDAKIVVRNLRRDVIDAVKKQQKGGEVSEDESRKGQESVQKITDKYTAEIETLLTQKEKEMMEV